MLSPIPSIRSKVITTSSIVLLLTVSLKLVPLDITSADALSIPRHLPLRRNSFHMNRAATMDSQSTKAANWRILPSEASDEHMESILSMHEVWSESQYEESLKLYKRFQECEDSYISSLIKNALCVLDQAYRLYGPESVICSYNGGKDAVVIFHLMRAAHARYFEIQRERDSSVRPTRPRVIYFDHEDEFNEIKELLTTSVTRYDIDMIAFEPKLSFSNGLGILVDHNNPYGPETASLPMAFVLGTRATDPNAGSQGHFSPSSDWMPPFMRVNPILEWSYGHVWHFLRLFHLPYCSLYDRGYTSLGTIKDTLPCPALAVAGSSRARDSVPKYWPAYMLRDWEEERAGRIPKEHKKAKDSDTPRRSATNAIQIDPSKTSNSSSQRSQTLSTYTDLGKAPMKAPASCAEPVSLSDENMEKSQSTISFGTTTTQRSVGLLIIGDEILKGMTADTNTQTAAKALWSQNVPLSKAVVVSDDPDEIMAEIKRLQQDVDVIITSGGVGPTHDDVTIKSVAAALNQELVLNDDMARLLRDKMNADGDDNGENDEELTEAQAKMATLPSNAKLRYLSANPKDWPFLQCRNIFILPGVPKFFEKKIETLSVYLSSQLERSITYKVVLSVDEASIVDNLNGVVKRHPQVSFGSYPFIGGEANRTVVTLEGRMIASNDPTMRNSTICLDPNKLAEERLSKEEMDYNVRLALDDLVTCLPQDYILRVDNNDGVLFD